MYSTVKMLKCSVIGSGLQSVCDFLSTADLRERFHRNISSNETPLFSLPLQRHLFASHKEKLSLQRQVSGTNSKRCPAA